MAKLISRFVEQGCPRFTLFSAILVLAAVSMPNPLFAQSGRVVFVLDGSNSMWGRIEVSERL
jgi:hypothetical protein